MMLDWLASYLLWISLLLLLVSSLTKKSLIALSGWLLFGVFWLNQPGHYMAINDYFNAILFTAAGLMCFYMAWIMTRRSGPSKAQLWASYAAAVCGMVYFPFAEIEPLREALIGFTTLMTVHALQALSVPVSMPSWNIMTLNGRSVEIILACTAIESIALFSGLIISVRAPIGRRAAALAVSIISIYILNLVRNGFVIMAYGWSWFGSASFEVAHNLIAKIGSVAALLLISYMIFLLLPELLSIIDELAADIRHPRGDAV